MNVSLLCAHAYMCLHEPAPTSVYSALLSAMADCWTPPRPPQPGGGGGGGGGEKGGGTYRVVAVYIR